MPGLSSHRRPGYEDEEGDEEGDGTGKGTRTRMRTRDWGLARRHRGFERGDAMRPVAP